MEVIVVKRISLFVLILSGMMLAACGNNDLAEELTPIPTMAPGQTPTLIAALPSSAESTQEAAPAEGTQEAGSSAAGDAAAGEALFTDNGCSGCHQENADQPGPSRTGMGERAATRIEGMEAADYLHQSIVDPHAFLVEGYGPIMPDTYSESLSEDDINNIVAYLLTQ
jgi:cytochrome c551/c552